VKPPKLPAVKNGGSLWGPAGKEHRELWLFAKAILRMDERTRTLFFGMAQGQRKEKLANWCCWKGESEELQTEP
jgi:hypothetical protein